MLLAIDQVVGYVRRYDPDRRYGFLVRDRFPDHVFFHRGSVRGPVPAVHSRVAFRVRETAGRPGRFEAYDVEAFPVPEGEV
jgi:hypothetical protein